MTAHSLIIAVVAGVVTGVAGLILAGRRRVLPVWLPVAAGIAGAALATILVWITDAVRPGMSDPVVVVQVLFAAMAVAAVVSTADRQNAAQSGAPSRSSNRTAGEGRLP